MAQAPRLLRFSAWFSIHGVLAAGLLLAAILCPRLAPADAYSGLAGKDTGALAGQGAVLPPGATTANHRLDSSFVPSTPEVPTPTARPNNWPGQVPRYPDTGYQPPPWIVALRSRQPAAGNPTTPAGQPRNAQGSPPAAKTMRCDDVRILARVGPEVILAGDVIALFVHGKLEELNEPIPEKYTEGILKSLLPHAITTKLMYLEAKRAIPEENLSRVKKEVRGYFSRKAIPDMMKRAKVSSVAELKIRLTDLGTSLDWQQHLFIERALGQQWMSLDVKFDKPVKPDEMLGYYREHLSDYEHPARARWEEIMVRFSKSPSKEAAYQKLVALGNQVMAGLPFAEAALRGSDGPTTADGGMRDWTTQGCLVSEQLEKALFGLPVGQLSPIFESDSGLHIVRVVERQAAHRTPFAEVQGEIRKKIQKRRRVEESQAYLAGLRDNTPIWTIYDDAVARKNRSKADDAPQRR